jgi:2-oxoglutarate dehydrogenase E1 component
MNTLSYIFNADSAYIDTIYHQFQADPESVDSDWRLFFEGFEFGSSDSTDGGTALSPEMMTKEFAVMGIIQGFRRRGHLLSTTNPVRQRKDRKPGLDLADFNLTEADMDLVFAAADQISLPNGTLRQVIEKMMAVYSGTIGYEYGHIESREKRRWLRERIEVPVSVDRGISVEKKTRILEKLNGAVVFEKFLHTKYIGQKRFSLEGGETTIPALDAIIEKAAESSVEEIVIGMAHRGRLNVLANIMGKTYENIFNEFEGNAMPTLSFGDGDVKYHLGYSSMVETRTGKKIHLKLAPNPSHLEAVNPVVEGFSRAKADILYKSDYDKILPILIHGDAAVAGQGIGYEVIQMSQLAGYYTGGTIHFVINNQIGFTTDFDDARSSTYCTSLANIVQAPVFHVNGDDPEAVVFAVELATEYRQKFNSDVFIDMVCYRKHGHNEGDDPNFTQPYLYNLIDKHKNPREIYVEMLVSRGDFHKEIAENMENAFWDLLQDRLNKIKEKTPKYTYQAPEEEWRKLKFTTDTADAKSSPDTGIAKAKLKTILDHLMTYPDGLSPLSKVDRLQKGKQKLLDDNKLDWALAELAAYSSILIEGKDVRMSGQDVKRGTFSHRHAIFNDKDTFKEYNRLDGIAENQGKFRIYNSLLSEFAVLGFEYGYSLANPNSLVIWEAQFGDFYNGAQTIVDQFISAGESKWRRMSGLVMLLPHGNEGQGPEHSSARLERFLQLTGDFNFTVANVSTPANFFHILRRQLARPYRKPLVIMSPKSLLRHPLCVSDTEDFLTKKKFQEVIADDSIAKGKATRHLLCTGKVYYDLLEYREANPSLKNVAITRIEQLYPFPLDQVNALLDANKVPTYWVQEESENMGAWQYLMRYWRKSDIEVVARGISASPATGFKKVHDAQQEDLVKRAFGVK